jgi:arylsulfatase A-like enzyme
MTERRPNVVVIVVDDLGFSDLGCFGSGIATPHLDRMAADGLRFTNFHTTPLCSPSRACILTGRNHHAVGWGYLVERAQPGYHGRIPTSAATFARVLRDSGYRTFALGKWHNVPADEQGRGRAHSAATRDRTAVSASKEHWPLGLGFERFYGFVNGMTDQYDPNLVRDDELIDRPGEPGDDYHFSEDLARQAIEYVDEAGDDPFLLYVATGAVHVPHQVPAEWIDRYRGRFDDGWDAERERRYRRQLELGVIPPGTTLTERPPMVPAWDELSETERRVFARQMETFAGFVSHTDAQLGRILDHLEETGVLDDTIVLMVSDNGAAGETANGAYDWEGFRSDGQVEVAAEHLEEFGSPGTFNCYASGWAWAGSTPLRMWKFYTWLGGVRVPLIVRWPAGIPEGRRGGIREQFAHAIDLMPTILDAVGVPVPEAVGGVPQQLLDGASIREAFADPDAPNARTTQYFEMSGSRAIVHDGWKATTDHIPAKEYNPAGYRGRREDGSLDFATDRWALFDLTADFSEAHDLAAEHPDRLAELIEVWEREAERNHVHPMDDSGG